MNPSFTIEFTSVFSGIVLISYLAIWYYFTPRKAFESHQDHNRGSFKEMDARIGKIERDTVEIQGDIRLQEQMLKGIGELRLDVNNLSDKISAALQRLAAAEADIKHGK